MEEKTEAAESAPGKMEAAESAPPADEPRPEEKPAGTEREFSREVPPPDDPTIWTKVRKGLAEGYHFAADKTDVYARIGKRRIAIIGINRNIERCFNELGEKVYNLLAAGGEGALADDLAVKELYGKIRALEEDLTAREAEIEQILQESRRVDEKE